MKALVPFVVDATVRRNAGVVVPIPTLPRKYDRVVVVAMRLPTVKLFDVVAMRVVPSASETMMEFGAKEVAFVPPFDTGSVPVT